jgi:hypothetical protein
MNKILHNRIDWRLAGIWLFVVWGVTLITKTHYAPAIAWTVIIVAYDFLTMICNKIMMKPIKEEIS